MHEILRSYTHKVISLLHESLDLSLKSTQFLGQIIMLIALVLIALIAYKLTVKIIRSAVIPILQRTKNKFDDLLLEHKFFRNISNLVPAFLIYYFVDDVIGGIPALAIFIHSTVEVVFILIIIRTSNSVLNTINDYYNRFDFAKDHPIQGVVQIIKIISYVIASIMVVAILFNKDLSSLVVSLGAVSAVLMLIFKDPILGFVGGLQLIFNKMLSIEDWITMPKFGADGKVKEINLTTVKVQNWDKTIVTIPTYSLISESFQNWKGMEDAGGRRIKRAVFIDMKTIRFCSEEMLERFNKIQVLHEYLSSTEEKVQKYNAENEIDPSILVNGRRQTNIGIFRAYLVAYLTRRQDVNKNLTFMVRQLPSSEKGLPIEIYVFANTTKWVDYEGIQSDIFDHIFAVIPEFDLAVYQFPTNQLVSPN